MIRKYKIYIIMGITVLLLFMVLPVNTKGDWEIPWDITLEGEGNDSAFRSSTVMENISVMIMELYICFTKMKMKLNF